MGIDDGAVGASGNVSTCLLVCSKTFELKYKYSAAVIDMSLEPLRERETGSIYGS